MKIAVTYDNGSVFQHFGKTENFKIFEGKINGCITNHPKGDRTFQWDCIFIPDGKNMTFAEMGTLEKNKISMRKQALTEFAKYLNEQ